MVETGKDKKYVLKTVFKVFKITLGLAVALYCSSLIYILSFAMKPNVPQHADAILVLGAKVNLDNSPSDPLYQRTLAAVNLYAKKKADYIITTGGVGLGSISEAKIGAEVASGLGVPNDKILEESNSHNTFQNVDEGRKVSREHNIKSVIVISDRFHVARGVMTARHFGFDPVYWDYPDSGYYKNEQLARNYAREALALLFYIPKLYTAK